MKAMLFAAGLGTRLRPLTNDRPKAMVEVAGKPLLEINIRRLINAGCDHIVINTHHFSEQIIDFVKSRKWDCQISIIHEKEMLLDTGGGLLNAKEYLEDDHFIVHNVDILSDLDLTHLAEQHQNSSVLGTLWVSDRSSNRRLLFNEQKLLSGWENKTTKETRLVRAAEELYSKAFNAIYVLSPEIFEWMPTEQKVFSMIDVFLNTAGEKRIVGFEDQKAKWLDVGTPKSLDLARKIFNF